MNKSDFINALKQFTPLSLSQMVLVDQLLATVTTDMVAQKETDHSDFVVFVRALVCVNDHEVGGIVFAKYCKDIVTIYNSSAYTNPFITSKLIDVWVLYTSDAASPKHKDAAAQLIKSLNADMAKNAIKSIVENNNGQKKGVELLLSALKDIKIAHDQVAVVNDLIKQIITEYVVDHHSIDYVIKAVLAMGLSRETDPVSLSYADERAKMIIDFFKRAKLSSECSTATLAIWCDWLSEASGPNKTADIVLKELGYIKYPSAKKANSQTKISTSDLEKSAEDSLFVETLCNQFEKAMLPVDTSLIEMLVNIPKVDSGSAIAVQDISKEIAVKLIKYDSAFIKTIGDITFNWLKNYPKCECIYNQIGVIISNMQNSRKILSDQENYWKPATPAPNFNQKPFHPIHQTNHCNLYGEQPYGNVGHLTPLAVELDKLAKAQLNVIYQMVGNKNTVEEISLTVGLPVVMIEQLILFYQMQFTQEIIAKQTSFGSGLNRNGYSPFQQDFNNLNGFTKRF